MEVFVCEEMWTELTVRQDDEEISVRNDRAVVKIDEVDAKLALYVPSDHNGLYSCFHTGLPGQLATILGIQDRNAVKVIYRILNDVKRDLDTIMKDEDLYCEAWLERPQLSQESLPLPIPDSTRQPTVNAVSSPPLTTHEDLLVLPTNGISSASQRPTPNIRPDPVTVEPVVRDSVWEQVARGEQYKKLLKEVIRQARRTRSWQDGSLSLFEIDEALDELRNPVDYAGFQREFGGTAHGSFVENARIGAAGELFVGSLTPT